MAAPLLPPLASAGGTALPKTTTAALLLLTALLFCGCSAAAAALLDANPALYLYSSLWLSDRQLDRTWTDRNVLLVGGSSGIGAELAVLLAGRGANLVVTGRDKRRLEGVVERCQSAAKKAHNNGPPKPKPEPIVHPLPLDLTAPDRTLSRAVDSALSALPNQTIDVLILNAGQGQLSPSLQTSSDTTRRLMEVNFHGPVRLCRLVMERDGWLERRRGHVVVTSSVLGKMAGPLSGSYAAAKHAVMGYFGTLRAELDWLRVDLPCPGPIDTAFGSRSLSIADSSSENNGRKGKNKREKSEMSSDNNNGSSEAGSYRSKMPARRCAELLLASMTGPQSLFSDTVLARQPTLGFAYLVQHLPGVARAVLGRMGPLRQRVWEAGLPLYDPASFRKVSAATAKAEKQRQSSGEVD